MPINIDLLREYKGGNIQLVRDSECKRGRDRSTVDKVIHLDEQWRRSLFDLEQLRGELNKISKDINSAKKTDSNFDCTQLIENTKLIKSQIKDIEAKVKDHKTLLNEALNQIGNIVAPSVLASSNEDDNPVLRTWKADQLKEVCDGTPGKLRHEEIMVQLGCLNLARGAEVAGHRGYFLMGNLVMLNQALILYGLNFIKTRGYILVQPPYFMRRSLMAHTAELADFEDTLYKIPMYADDKDDLLLIATSEQPISALHYRETLNAKQLPIKYGGISTCFRKEAGAHGKDMRGIFRTHQFEKVEQFVFAHPSTSTKLHEEMIGLAEEFYQSLNLPYRVVSIVAGALNNAAAIKYDLEAWFPGYDAYRELVSCSNCTDYQSRGLETRLAAASDDPTEGTNVHMLNATLCATERTMCCILENYQEKTGVRVPPVLVPYMGGVDFLPYPEPRETEP